MDHRIITVEGPIGSGKTSLAGRLAEDYRAKLVLETFADNPFLQKFLVKQQDYALGMEMCFMAERYEQLKDELGNWELFRDRVVVDYLFTKSLLYAKANLDETEYGLYQKIFNILNPKLPQSDIIIYLHSSPDRLMANIQKRGREFERTIKKEYLRKIEDIYFEYFKQLNDQRIVILDVSGVDFVNNENDYLKIREIIEYDLAAGMHRFKI